MAAQTITCHYCNRPFTAYSSRAMYCSDGHRVEAWRSRKFAELRELRARFAADTAE